MNDHEDTKIDPAGVQVSVLSRGIVGAQLAIDAVMPLGDVALRVRESGKLATATLTVRRVLAQEGRGGGYERRKLLLPAAVPAAQAPAGTPLKQLPVEHHNGLYGFDLDEDRDNLDVAAVRTALERHPAVVLVGISAAGDALYAWAAGPVATSATEYKAMWGEIAKRLPADAAVQNDARAHNFNRVRMLASDPTLYLATEATPFAARDRGSWDAFATVVIGASWQLWRTDAERLDSAVECGSEGRVGLSLRRCVYSTPSEGYREAKLPSDYSVRCCS